MNTEEIATALKRDLYARRVFGGVYPQDKLPRVASYPSAFVINTDRSEGPGEHWVAVWLDGRGKAEYFDSFGLPPSFYEGIEHFILNHSYRYRYNQRLLQDLTSSACGYYVLYFVLKKSRGASLPRLLAPFHPHKLRTNDQKVTSYVRALKKEAAAMMP